MTRSVVSAILTASVLGVAFLGGCNETQAKDDPSGQETHSTRSGGAEVSVPDIATQCDQLDGFLRCALKGADQKELFSLLVRDFDGDGRKDLWNSAPDALASAANYLRASGYQKDVPWGVEVLAPSGFDW